VINIVEIIKPADQGRTTPFLCKASDGNTYYVKGHAATVAGLMKEWLGAHLAHSFGLPVPSFQIAFVDSELVSGFGGKAVSELKGGFVFASQKVPSATELKYETQKLITANLKLSLLIFDLWVENEDRTLTENGGNPNLLWRSDNSTLYVIDHNLIFDKDFSKANFWSTHVFKDMVCNKQDDVVEKMDFEARMNKALACWQSAWDNMPKTWLEFNQEFACFDPEKHLLRLTSEANGKIWLKMP
jgi:hypothetical protein